jgi:hypothetical protein
MLCKKVARGIECIPLKQQQIAKAYDNARLQPRWQRQMKTPYDNTKWQQVTRWNPDDNDR